MKFTIAIEQGASSWGVVVPDLPGCISAGDTPEDAMENAQEAICAWAEDAALDGEALPLARPLAHWQAQPEYQGWLWAMVDAPVERYFGPAEKVDVTLPKLLLGRIDDYIRRRGGTRNSFLTDAAAAALHGA